MASEAMIGGQQAWIHDEGFPAGYFHTFDSLRVAGEGDKGRKVHVFLPRDYEQSQERYPVVYMNDGDTAFWKGGFLNRSWRVQDKLAELYATRGLRKVIVVAIHHRLRPYEYLTDPDVYKGAWCGGLPDYANYLADPLKDFIDRNYRTLPGRTWTTIVGSSHGGVAAFYTGVIRGDRFGNAAAMSSSFWTGNLNSRGITRSEWFQRPRDHLSPNPNRPRLWICWGLRRYTHPASIIESWSTHRSRKLVRILERDFGFSRGVDLFVHEDPLGGHDPDAWHYRFGEALMAFYWNS